MGLLSGLIKAGIAKKAVDEARKPQNQAKVRELIAKVRAGNGPGSAPRR